MRVLFLAHVGWFLWGMGTYMLTRGPQIGGADAYRDGQSNVLLGVLLKVHDMPFVPRRTRPRTNQDRLGNVAGVIRSLSICRNVFSTRLGTRFFLSPSRKARISE